MEYLLPVQMTGQTLFFGNFKNARNEVRETKKRANYSSASSGDLEGKGEKSLRSACSSMGSNSVVIPSR